MLQHVVDEALNFFTILFEREPLKRADTNMRMAEAHQYR